MHGICRYSKCITHIVKQQFVFSENLLPSHFSLPFSFSARSITTLDGQANNNTHYLFYAHTDLLPAFPAYDLYKPGSSYLMLEPSHLPAPLNL
jgi:hypothetical protein